MSNKHKICFYFFPAILPAFLAGFFVFGARADESHIIINQIMIEDCTDTKNEFIELYNNSDSDVDLDGYKLTKKTKSGSESNLISSSKFKGDIPARGYFLIAQPDYAPFISADLSYSGSSYSIAKDNSVILYNAEGAVIDEVGFGDVTVYETKPTSNPSKGKGLLRTDHKDSDNNFNDFAISSPIAKNSKYNKSGDGLIISCLSASLETDNGISIKFDKEIYTNIYANFEVKYAGATSATKYTWNFGDNHKSYKQKTTHKFISPGKYQASITIRGDKSARKDFEIIVEDYEAPKIKIIKISPNPQGKDQKNECIEIKNDSKEKVDLENWIIATGWDKLINHKITKKLVIRPKKSAKITSKHCAFTLNNTKNKIELKDPSGETVQKLKYDRKKEKMEENEIFTLSRKKWSWDKSQVQVKEDTAKNEEGASVTIENSIDAGENNEDNLKIDLDISDSKKIEENAGKFTPDISWENKKQNRIQLISYGTTINTPRVIHSQSMVSGVSTKKIPPEEKHWTAILLDNSIRKLNYGINWIINNL